ncbi:MAG: T9SS type A sorting domain-containing protein, partial [Bacteroidetes bacterium]|nr:T9SS type A sorting domain-containing protein [Bacteroidota bacterium]
YPNPSSNVVNVITENWMGGQLQVFDLTGRQVANQNITSGRTVINVSEWNAGLYQVVLMNKGQKVVSAIVVE